MSFPLHDFEGEFMRRTLEVIKDYKGPRDATLLVNCLLGLLIVPKEKSFKKVPADPLSDLKKWGINPDSIECFNECECGDREGKTLRDVVHRLRNAVAHFNIKPIQDDSREGPDQVVGFEFSDRNGFRGRFLLDEMKEFVTRLANHLSRHKPKNKAQVDPSSPRSPR